MRWYDYYEKINYWSVSTAVSKISSLEDMGAPNEIVDALYIIAFEDKKGANKLLNRALQHGVKFSGDNLVEISGLCAEENFKKALYQSAGTFTVQDVEALYGCVDTELIIDVVKRYKLYAPVDIVDAYGEELCSDADVPISWNRFYEAFYNWDSEYSKARLQAVTDFGNDDEVLEVAQELFWNDKYEASKFITRALEAGVRFRNENLAELTDLCNEDTVKKAALLSGLLLTDESQDELCEEDEEKQEDLSFEIQSAISAADYAWGCLAQAQRALNDSENVSFIDMMSKGVFTSVWKYSSLSVADAELQQAQDALCSLNVELKNLQNNKSVKLKSSRLANEIDMWIDAGFWDVLTHLQINKAQKRIRQAIKQVNKIHKELVKLLEKT